MSVSDRVTPAVADERKLAAELFNGVWALLDKEVRSADEDDRMLHMAHASRYHWGQVGAPVNLSRGEWQCSRVYATLGRAEPALHHARRVVELCELHDMGAFDFGCGYEALARACAVSGDLEAARQWTERALAAAAQVTDEEDRTILLGDLETIPGQPRFW